MRAEGKDASVESAMRRSNSHPPARQPMLDRGEPRERVPGEIRAAGPGFTFGNLPILPRPTVAPDRDVQEREADQMADRVMRMPDPVLVTTRPGAAVHGATIQRECAEWAEKNRQLRPEAAGLPRATTAAADLVHDVVRSPGQPLDAATRQFMEHRFGHDFRSVRVHADAAAGYAARALQARAFTVQNDITFAPGEYAPESTTTRRLLAHELTHVVQQRGDGHRAAGSTGITVQRQPDPGAPAPAAPTPVPGPTLMMAKPPHFPQTALTCWASAIASWQRVKGFVASNVTDQTLIDYYRGTPCVDEKNALVGDTDADVEAVYAEWRLSLSISSEVPDASWTFDFVKSLIENHGHFIVATGDRSLMHSMVAYGVQSMDKRDPTNFTVYVEDPLASDNAKHAMFFERPIRIVLGTEKRAGVAPCKSRRTSP